MKLNAFKISSNHAVYKSNGDLDLMYFFFCNIYVYMYMYICI